jgi:hypothetical protein
MCIYISFIFGNYICDEGVPNPGSSRPGVGLNREWFGFRDLRSTPPECQSSGGGALLGASQRRAYQGLPHLPFLKAKAALKPGVPGSPPVRRNLPLFLYIFRRRLRLVALFSCLYSNNGYFCIQCEYLWPPFPASSAIPPPGLLFLPLHPPRLLCLARSRTPPLPLICF